MSNDNEGNEFFEIRCQKLKQLRKQGIDPYPYKFEPTDSSVSAKEKFDPDSEEEIGPEVSVAGRVMTRRLHGSAAFADLQDEEGQIQVYFSGKYLDDSDDFEQFENLWDVGDIVGIRGGLFETGEGEITVVAREVKMLSKGLRPLPEKFHGLQDKELRYRKRSLDMISNPEVKEIFKMRSKIVSLLRRGLEDRGFLEVETPMMQKMAGGADAQPFETHHNALHLDLYLRIAPELFLKRLLVGGFEKVFEVNRNFRNEGISTRHNPEFTMMELYWAYADYYDIMDLTEQICADIVEKISGGSVTEFNGKKIDWSAPWDRYPLLEIVNERTGLDVSLSQSASEIYQQAVEAGIEPEEKNSSGAQLLEIFEEEIEGELVKPTFITEFPAEVSPLAKPHRNKEGVCERFELFAGGLEIGNAYSELNDPLLQRKNFEGQVEAGGEIDEPFVEALEYGMPPAGGLGIGIDRLVMLISGATSIRDVILFPLLQPRKEQ
jgi:lysyl-tRNA synthetase class 2